MVSVYKDIDGKLIKIAEGEVPTPDGIAYADRINQIEAQRNERENIFKGIDSELLARFKKYHTENPHVYKLFMQYVNQLRSAGRDRYSAWAIINRIRWDYDISTTGDPFKISNDYIALYARLAYYHNPDLKEFFVMRPMKGKNRHFTEDDF